MQQHADINIHRDLIVFDFLGAIREVGMVHFRAECDVIQNSTMTTSGVALEALL
jgi:hypothetical protein